MKVCIPDSLMNYERNFLASLLEEKGYVPIFERFDSDAEVILTGGFSLSPRVLKSFKKLWCIIRFARGRSDLSIEKEFCRCAGIEHHMISGASAPSTAEHTVMFMLALLRRLPEATNAMHSGNWNHKEIAESGIRDLSEVTVGLIGLGKVGRKVCTLLKAFGTKITYFKPHPLPRSEEIRLGVTWRDLDTLVQESDVISLHARDSIRKGAILTKKHIHMFKPGAIFINTGNGRHVDQKTLLKRIQEGALLVGLDVFSEEPWVIPNGNKQFIDRQLFTPHIAGRSKRTARELLQEVCNTLDYCVQTRKIKFKKIQVVPTSEIPDAGHARYPLLRRILQILPSKPFLVGYNIKISNLLKEELPFLEPYVKTFGCQEVEWLDLDQKCLILAAPWGRIDFLFHIFQPSRMESNRDNTFSIPDVPAFRFLLERWQLDYELWDKLLPREARGSLPGHPLLIHGYNPRGRSIAWRAREIGMQVFIHEEDLQLKLEANYDGFDTISLKTGTPPGCIQVNTEPLNTDVGLNPFILPSSIPPGLIDELMALSVIALYVLSDPGLYREKRLDKAKAFTICNRLFLDLLASVRTKDHVSSSTIWTSDSW